MSDHRTHDDWEGLVLAAGYDFVMFDGLSSLVRLEGAWRGTAVEP